MQQHVFPQLTSTRLTPEITERSRVSCPVHFIQKISLGTVEWMAAVIAVCLVILNPSEGGCSPVELRLKKLLSTSQAVGVSVVELPQEHPYPRAPHTDRRAVSVFEHNATALLKPASTLKIITAAASLQQLGPAYQFRTEFYVSGSPSRPDISIRGSGDPSFAIEEAWVAVRELKKRGVTAVHDILVDASAFEQEKISSGQRAYEAGSSALSFNYNSVNITICPTSVGKPARVLSDPEEAEIRFFGEVITTAGKGASVSVDQVESRKSKTSSSEIFSQYRVTGKISVNSPCKVVYRSVQTPPLYLGHVFRKLLSANEIPVSGGVRAERSPISAQLLYANLSKPLVVIVRDLNHFSNNFIANQLLFALGGDESNAGSVRTEQRGIAALERAAKLLGVSALQVHDGSGLSAQNRISARGLATALANIYGHPDFGPEFVQSLPVSGRSGTLRDRTFSRPAGIIRAKTGTIAGVSSLAGYLITKSGKQFAFAILINQSEKDSALALENKIIQTLYDQ